VPFCAGLLMGASGASNCDLSRVKREHPCRIDTRGAVDGEPEAAEAEGRFGSAGDGLSGATRHADGRGDIGKTSHRRARPESRKRSGSNCHSDLTSAVTMFSCGIVYSDRPAASRASSLLMKYRIDTRDSARPLFARTNSRDDQLQPRAGSHRKAGMPRLRLSIGNYRPSHPLAHDGVPSAKRECSSASRS
jgi:hypothetical protein